MNNDNQNTTTTAAATATMTLTQVREEIAQLEQRLTFLRGEEERLSKEEEVERNMMEGVAALVRTWFQDGYITSTDEVNGERFGRLYEKAVNSRLLPATIKVNSAPSAPELPKGEVQSQPPLTLLNTQQSSTTPTPTPSEEKKEEEYVPVDSTAEVVKEKKEEPAVAVLSSTEEEEDDSPFSIFHQPKKEKEKDTQVGGNVLKRPAMPFAPPVSSKNEKLNRLDNLLNNNNNNNNNNDRSK